MLVQYCILLWPKDLITTLGVTDNLDQGLRHAPNLCRADPN